MSNHDAHAHWHWEYGPFLVGFGGFFFLPWAFMFQFVYGNGLWAVIALGIAVLFLISGAISWVGHTIGVIHDEGWSPAAMIMFIGTEVMTVAGIIAAYWVVRFQAPIWPPEGSPELHMPLMSTAILIISSFSIAMARRKQMAGDAGGFASMTMVTAVIWIIFAVMTFQGWQDLTSQGFTINTNALGTALYSITGIHFAHIIFGLAILLLAIPPALKGRLSPSYARSMTMYVHFVNILSIWVLFQVYVW